MPVFYTQEFHRRVAILNEEESRHLIRVLRLKENDQVELVDGRGTLYKGTVSLADPRGSKIRILETCREHLARNYSLHLAIAPTKSSERFEWFLEKATEIGIEEITPILCDRSERNIIRHERSVKILVAAMKQSGRAYLPQLNPIIPLPELLESARADIKYIAHCRSRTGISPELPATGKPSWLILIGPEGDFTEAEVELAKSMRFREINLGEAVYRTETAGIIACQLVNFIHGSGSMFK
jgi:16S rRNA (uracil1498-N3)-methyltransferase